MDRRYPAEERVTYAVTLSNNRRGAAKGVLCGSAPRSLLLCCALNTSHISVNQQETVEEAVFSVEPPGGYIQGSHAARIYMIFAKTVLTEEFCVV
jgi:hypothetical protein